MTKLMLTFRKFCKTPRSYIQRKFTQALYTAVFIYRRTHTLIVQKERDQYNYPQSTFKWILKVTTRYVLLFSHFIYTPVYLGNFAVTPAFTAEFVSKVFFGEGGRGGN